MRLGKLSASIETETFERDGLFVGVVGTNLKYGKYLELGTRKMAKRPYLRPALDSQRSRIIKDIKAAGKRMQRGT
jgi:HK97 gp10 family phage protein